MRRTFHTAPFPDDARLQAEQDQDDDE